ncbi:hypothetical protein GKO32_14580 [Amycolatopsis sp. RM579]|uniref:DUF7144 domain-containing protein n=2 Tax=Amycolatopsis pithecellobii TaxID=664692 RepID=A0A6N7Z2M4_9PSEU|nr:hypothetical protein [Amycolatopsis pithecellobii]MTD55199.1 hypothetical protein [Amycolatopsis pithecellobii]
MPPPPRTAPVSTEYPRSGKLMFGGVMMIVAGLFNVIIGLVALFNSAYYVTGPSGVLVLNLTGWGWLHLILGALVVITGGALFTGATWARVITVLLAGFNALASLAFVSAYPLWSIIVIALDVLVIWAVITADAEAEA